METMKVDCDGYMQIALLQGYLRHCTDTESYSLTTSWHSATSLLVPVLQDPSIVEFIRLFRVRNDLHNVRNLDRFFESFVREARSSLDPTVQKFVELCDVVNAQTFVTPNFALGLSVFSSLS